MEWDGSGIARVVLVARELASCCLLVSVCLCARGARLVLCLEEWLRLRPALGKPVWFFFWRQTRTTDGGERKGAEGGADAQ
jgi:hypothetical protein